MRRPKTEEPAETSPGRELELVRAVIQRDRKATAEFVAAYADAVYGFLRRRLFPRTDLLEDLLQEVFLSAFQSLSQFHGGSLQSWLIGIARHTVQDYYRAQLRTATLDESHAEPVIEPPFDDWIHEGQLSERVQRTMAELPEAYRWALLWRYWEKSSAAEIALRCGKTEKAVERTLARAREQFRRRWHES